MRARWWRCCRVTKSAQVIAPPPQSASELRTRIDAARLERLEGRGILLLGLPSEVLWEPVGLFRVRELERGFGSAEWEFVLSPEQWGSGLFFAAAPAVVDFAFDVLGVHRLEARAAVHNGRGNGALRKIGAAQEGVLRRSLQQEHGWADQALWTLIADDWRKRRGAGEFTKDEGRGRRTISVPRPSSFVPRHCYDPLSAPLRLRLLLPDQLIAQAPSAERGASRLLVVDRARGTWSDRSIADLPELLAPSDLLVVNNSRSCPRGCSAVASPAAVTSSACCCARSTISGGTC